MASKTFTDALLTGALPPLLARYARLVEATTRWDTHGQDHMDALTASGRPFIAAFWHARLLMTFRLAPIAGRPVAAMVSAHRHGEAVAKTLSALGVGSVRGSAQDPRKPEKDKGGANALRALIGHTKRGDNVAITPDGPRGPAGRAQPGVAQLSRLTGLPVLPIAWATSRSRTLGTWDRFVLPYPGGRGVFVFGEPISVTRGAGGTEQGRQAIENALNAVTERADAAAGQVALPAPALGSA